MEQIENFDRGMRSATSPAFSRRGMTDFKFKTEKNLMSIEDPKSTVLEFYKSFDERNIERAFSFLDKNFTAYMAGMPKTMDREQFQQFGIEFYSAFALGQHKFDEVIVANNKVITCGKFSAKHLGEFQGLPPTKKQIEISVMHIDRVENSKIIEHWGQGDARGLMEQLGIMFLPSPKLIPHIAKNILSKFFKPPNK